MIGFIGLGNIGEPIARRLLLKYGELLVFDRNPAALSQLVEAGAVAAKSARAVADRAECVFACLPDVETSCAVASEIAAGKAVKTYAEFSTIGRLAMRRISGILGETGISLIDAPVSGGAQAAANGTISVMLAGAPAACAGVSAALEGVTGKIVRIGSDAGQAQLCKLVNNALSFTALVVSSEAVVVGAKAGIAPSALLAAIAAGTGKNSAIADKIPRTVVTRSFDLGAGLGAALKDLQLYLDEAQAAGQTPGVIAETDLHWRKAVDQIGADADASRIAAYFEDLVGTRIQD